MFCTVNCAIDVPETHAMFWAKPFHADVARNQPVLLTAYFAVTAHGSILSKGSHSLAASTELISSINVSDWLGWSTVVPPYNPSKVKYDAVQASGVRPMRTQMATGPF